MNIENIKKPTKDQSNNILISDIGFTAEELSSDQSQASRSVNTTKILNGTTYTTQGEYLPMSWTFKTHLYYETGTEWNALIQYLESGTHEVISPLIGEMFNATVRVTRVPVSQELMELSFTITEVPDVSDYTVDNSLYMGKHLSIQEVHDQQEESGGGSS